MDENRTAKRLAPRRRPKRLRLGLGIAVLLLLVFHRPILQTVARRVLISIAAGENLKLDFRIDGSVLGGVTLRNVHATATGPSAVQSAEVDLARLDYSLWGLLTDGMAEFLQTVELRNVSLVLDPLKAPPPVEPKKDQKFSLPALFPHRLTLADVNVKMASQPADLVIEHLYLDLQPEKPGQLRIGKLQIPSGRSWADVAAQATYENRNLFVRNLNLDEETKIEVVNIDASKIGQNQLDLGLQGKVAGGTIDTTLSLGAKAGSVETKVDLNVEDTSIDAVRTYLQSGETAQNTVERQAEDPASIAHAAEATAKSAEAVATGQKSVTKEEKRAAGGDIDSGKPRGLIPPGIRGDVKKLSIHGSGTADQPSSWSGTIIGQIDNLAAGGMTFDRANVDIKAANGTAQINTLELSRGANQITLQGTSELPDRMAGFGHKPATIQLRGQLAALGEIIAGSSQPITGSAEVNGQIKVVNDTVHADIVLAGGPVNFGPATAQKFVVKFNATRQMPPADEGRPYFDGLTANVRFDLMEVRATDYAVDSVHGELQSAGQQVHIQQLLVRRAENQLALNGTYQLPRDFRQALEQPAHVAFALDAPQIDAFWAGEALVTGALQANGAVDYQRQLGPGYFEVYGSNLRARNLAIPQLSVQGTTANNVVYLNDLTASLNQQDYVRAHGTFLPQPPYRYSGTLSTQISDLRRLEPMLEAAGRREAIAGALALDWSGSGQLEGFRNSGDLKLRVENGRFGEHDKLQVQVDANFSPEVLNVPIIYVSSDKLMLQAIMQAKDQTLEMTRIQIDQGEAKYASGYVSVPFIWSNLGTDRPLFAPAGQVLVSFQSENLDINKLAKDFHISFPIAGAANVKLEARGPLENLRADLDVRMTGLRSEKLSDFTPATFALNGHLENNQLVIDGKLEQARIAPVQITGNIPLPVATIVANRKLDDRTPVTGTVRMPRSSMNFVRQFIPALLTVDGDVALTVDIGGTIANPVLGGSGDVNVNVARFKNPTLPAVSAFRSRLVFAGNTLSLEQFRGELAGGPFTVTGRVAFPKLTEPTLDLAVRADAVLVARNDDLTARADANLRVVGPLAAANVTGNVALTNSRFLKNIDIIPIGLPGRPAPRPKPPRTQEILSFPNPPLRDWKFDVAITTKDPFLLRGNLANGGAIVDARLVGTGLQPGLTGMVRLQNVEATLPFSRLAIDQGFLYFDGGDPMNPRLELQGTSLVRDYTIRVFVYGTANNPEAVFSSEPPLPQEEIISLLATGTTREELLSGGNVLAGRAAILLVQQLYRKVFKKGDPTTGDTTSFFDRLDLDVGTVDPRTGQQSATARFRVNQQFVLIGTVGVEGDFRGMVKYLLRFR